jgi:hypothetical protein
VPVAAARPRPVYYWRDAIEGSPRPYDDQGIGFEFLTLEGLPSFLGFRVEFLKFQGLELTVELRADHSVGQADHPAFLFAFDLL